MTFGYQIETNHSFAKTNALPQQFDLYIYLQLIEKQPTVDVITVWSLITVLCFTLIFSVSFLLHLTFIIRDWELQNIAVHTITVIHNFHYKIKQLSLSDVQHNQQIGISQAFY